MPPQRGRDRPRKVLVDKETTSAPHAPLPKNDLSVPSEFLVPPIPQAGLFSPMTSESFHAFTTFQYAQAQAQAQTKAKKGQFLMPPIAPFVPPLAQPAIKLSKLVKEARQLGCETFSGTVDAVTTKNQLKRVFDTLTDIELNDKLKLRVTIRLIDKSAITWWDNLKLRSIDLVTWNYFVQEFSEHYYTHFHRDKKKIRVFQT